MALLIVKKCKEYNVIDAYLCQFPCDNATVLALSLFNAIFRLRRIEPYCAILKDISYNKLLHKQKTSVRKTLIGITRSKQTAPTSVSE